MPKFEEDQITYELFGINPPEFYAKRFDLGGAVPDLLASALDWHEISRTKVRLLVEALRRHLPRGGEVLDLGCGSGPFGPTLLSHVPGLRLVGIDMSEVCIEQARLNGYAEACAADFLSGLPYADGRFDGIISVDVFGHVEFRHKDALVDELARVTKPGGINVHGAESGWVDYFNCTPSDPDDPIRRYVWVEGHVAVEPAVRLAARFRRAFRRVETDVTFLWPFLPGQQGAELLLGADAGRLDGFFSNPDNLYAANVLTGAANRHFIRLLKEVFGPAFHPQEMLPPWYTEGRTLDLPDANNGLSPHWRERLAALWKPCGFTTFDLTR